MKYSIKCKNTFANLEIGSAELISVPDLPYTSVLEVVNHINKALGVYGNPKAAVGLSQGNTYLFARWNMGHLQFTASPALDIAA